MRVPSVVIITILVLVACSFSDARKAPAEEWLDEYIMHKIQTLSRNNRFFTREFDKSNWGFFDMSIHYKPDESDSSSGNNKNPYFSREFNPARNWLFDLKHDRTEPDEPGSGSSDNKSPYFTNDFDLRNLLVWGYQGY